MALSYLLKLPMKRLSIILSTSIYVFQD